MKRLLFFLCCLTVCATNAWAVVQSSRTFDGTNDEVDWGNAVDVTDNNVSWCIWANPTEDAGDDFWLGKKSGTSTSAGYDLEQNSSDQFVCRAADGIAGQSSGGSDLDGVWTFVCCEWNGTDDDMFTYENGVQVASDTTGTVGSLTNTVNLTAGESDGNSSDATGSACFGSIFLSKLLSVTEMLELMWKPEGIGSSDFAAPLMGDATEPEWAAKLSGTVSGTDAANGKQPPVLFGLGLPI